MVSNTINHIFRIHFSTLISCINEGICRYLPEICEQISARPQLLIAPPLVYKQTSTGCCILFYSMLHTCTGNSADGIIHPISDGDGKDFHETLELDFLTYSKIKNKQFFAKLLYTNEPILSTRKINKICKNST